MTDVEALRAELKEARAARRDLADRLARAKGAGTSASLVEELHALLEAQHQTVADLAIRLEVAEHADPAPTWPPALLPRWGSLARHLHTRRNR